MKNTEKALFAFIAAAFVHELATEAVHQVLDALGVTCLCNRR